MFKQSAKLSTLTSQEDDNYLQVEPHIVVLGLY